MEKIGIVRKRYIKIWTSNTYYMIGISIYMVDVIMYEVGIGIRMVWSI